ncbi:phage tail assembly chaperone [Pseudomonas sp. SK2]|uniref:phage tail assembly chaperone n=1 Tax=Pseudomonas sp. SK2 TaxID=2841063 RepID=UPI00192BCB1C|nr:phage tail assembly chaperone [Pseudomonas sp. SK2]QQZ36051.1 phage tail protein [Pseudomonas sp. SK2]
MKRLYSRSTGFCYLQGIHQGIPGDAVEISDDRFVTVIGNPDPGKVRSHDEDGLPILVDPPALSEIQLVAKERAWRDAELASVQWIRDRHRDEQDLGGPTTLSDERFIEFLTYLQALRDWPAAASFPDSAARPTAPIWVAEEIQ